MTYDSLSSVYCHGVRLVALLESDHLPASAESPVVRAKTPVRGRTCGMPRYCCLLWCWLQVERGFSSLPSVTCVLGATRRPVVHTDSCSALDRTTGLLGIACTWPKQQQQTNYGPARKNLGLSSMPAASRECFIDTMLVADGQHPCGFCCCCSFF